MGFWIGPPPQGLLRGERGQSVLRVLVLGVVAALEVHAPEPVELQRLSGGPEQVVDGVRDLSLDPQPLPPDTCRPATEPSARLHREKGVKRNGRTRHASPSAH